MADNQYPGSIAHTKQEKPVFIFRIIIIKKLTRIVIEEGRTGFLERYLVLLEVRFSLLGAPIELSLTYIICMPRGRVKSLLSAPRSTDMEPCDKLAGGA